MISHNNPSPIRKIPLFDLSEMDFVISNFLCQNVQTTVGGGGVRAKSERPNFLRPYLPNGGGGSRGLDNVQSLVVFFFLMAPLSNKYKNEKKKNPHLNFH